MFAVMCVCRKRPKRAINVNLVSKSIPFYRDFDGKNLRFRILVPSTYVRISLLLDQRGKGGSVNASLLERF